MHLGFVNRTFHKHRFGCTLRCFICPTSMLFALFRSSFNIYYSLQPSILAHTLTSVIHGHWKYVKPSATNLSSCTWGNMNGSDKQAKSCLYTPLFLSINFAKKQLAGEASLELDKFHSLKWLQGFLKGEMQNPHLQILMFSLFEIQFIFFFK